MPKYGAGFGRGRILERCQKLGYCPFQRFSEPSFSNTAQGPQLKHVDTPGSGYVSLLSVFCFRMSENSRAGRELCVGCFITGVRNNPLLNKDGSSA